MTSGEMDNLESKLESLETKIKNVEALCLLMLKGKEVVAPGRYRSGAYEPERVGRIVGLERKLFNDEIYVVVDVGDGMGDYSPEELSLVVI